MNEQDLRLTISICIILIIFFSIVIYIIKFRNNNIDKINNEENTWTLYQDVLEDKKMSVRVDTKYVNMKYKNTYYVQVKYSESEITELPNVEFFKYVASFEDKILEVVQETFEDHVVFLGTATFGGSSYITFASDLDIMWVEFLKEKIDKDIIAGIYKNDNMGYYDMVLYPEFMRK